MLRATDNRLIYSAPRRKGRVSAAESHAPDPLALITGNGIALIFIWRCVAVHAPIRLFSSLSKCEAHEPGTRPRTRNERTFLPRSGGIRCRATTRLTGCVPALSHYRKASTRPSNRRTCPSRETTVPGLAAIVPANDLFARDSDAAAILSPPRMGNREGTYQRIRPVFDRARYHRRPLLCPTKFSFASSVAVIPRLSVLVRSLWRRGVSRAGR